MLSNKLSKTEEENLELQDLSSSMESIYKQKHADLEDAIRAFQTKKPSPTKSNNYSNMAALRGKPTFLDFCSEDWMESMAEDKEDFRQQESPSAEKENPVPSMSDMAMPATGDKILKRDHSLASTVNKPIEMTDDIVSPTEPSQEHEEKYLQNLSQSIPSTPPPKASSYSSILEQKDLRSPVVAATAAAAVEPAEYPEEESEIEKDEQDKDIDDEDDDGKHWAQGFQETADYRSVYGTHKIKGTASTSNNNNKTLPTVAGTSTIDKGATPRQHEEASASVRFKRYQKDLVMASVDPSTARKCMMAEYCTYFRDDGSSL